MKSDIVKLVMVLVTQKTKFMVNEINDLINDCQGESEVHGLKSDKLMFQKVL